MFLQFQNGLRVEELEVNKPVYNKKERRIGKMTDRFLGGLSMWYVLH